MDDNSEGSQTTLSAEQSYRVGDHVTDREEDESKPMLVVGIPGRLAWEYRVEGANQTVAELNEEYPKADEVVEVVFVQKTDADLSNLKRYAYPASRLKRRHPVHPTEENDDSDNDGGGSSAEYMEGPA